MPLVMRVTLVTVYLATSHPRMPCVVKGGVDQANLYHLARINCLIRKAILNIGLYATRVNRLGRIRVDSYCHVGDVRRDIGFMCFGSSDLPRQAAAGYRIHGARCIATWNAKSRRSGATSRYQPALGGCTLESLLASESRWSCALCRSVPGLDRGFDALGLHAPDRVVAPHFLRGTI